ncbi:hypothetical protein CFC21_020102 [Triticum aestivum]|uniref:NB-ARC domain-containing protein n=2 Tax=Triticum aestivum TaxID=4565 RepID=A0A9R1E6Z7_WHEAT|nr:disease resistance protein RGA2-like [Triticum aestivum]KAF7004939.1 hypothetical protein CFC21_020102 [Triticum aestivum]
MSLPAIGIIGAINECASLFQSAKSVISSLHSRWSGSQEQSLQGRVLQLESDLQHLCDTLPAMYDLINGAEYWRSHKHRMAVAQLLRSLKDTVSDAEDLIDEFRWYQMKVKVQSNASQSPFIDFLDKVIQGDFNKLKDVQLRLNHLSSQLQNMGLHGVTQRFDKSVRPETTSLPNEREIFGRDEELKKALGFLNVPTNLKRKRATSSVNAPRASTSNQFSNESRISDLPVLPLLGIGGVGKTTLAQHICSHQRVKYHFEMIIWICVSDDFDVKRLTKEVMQSCTGKEEKNDNLDSLQRALHDYVDNKRLLIVLDDIWDDALKENGQCWKRFLAPFRSAQEGSTMLVTTRCPKVTEGVRTMEPIKLEGLKDDVFWKFFKLCAFGSEDSDNDPELENIGKGILPKLKGSPLAAKTLGRMLSMDLQASNWKFILESELWTLPQGETDILPALRLSYMYLPFYLKQCFSICAMYPKDYKFEKACLAEIWAAEGFVEPQHDLPIQDISCQYFEDLVARSFFQEVSGGYVIHDLLHDMAQKVSEHDCFILRNEGDFDKIPQNVRHLYVLPSKDFDDCNLSRLCKYTKLRTLICKKNLGINTRWVMDQWCTELPRMRVISCAYANKLPDSIGNWKHLRYLEISNACPFTTIPSTFCWLYNLQILYAKKCKLRSLPEGFDMLTSLQKFELYGLTYCVGCHLHLGRPTDAQGQGIRLLKNLNQFRGHLKLSSDGKLSIRDATEAELMKKKYIGELKLCMRSTTPSDKANEIEVLQVLQPPTSLTSLVLQGCSGVSLPRWFKPENFQSLKSLTFECCDGLKSIKINAKGIFLSLTDLTIGRCDNISSLEHFLHRDYIPAIKIIRIEECKSLETIPDEAFGNLHFLEELHMVGCPNLVSIGGAKAVAKVKNVQISNCPKLKEAEIMNRRFRLRDWYVG